MEQSAMKLVLHTQYPFVWQKELVGQVEFDVQVWTMLAVRCIKRTAMRINFKDFDSNCLGKLNWKITIYISFIDYKT